MPSSATPEGAAETLAGWFAAARPRLEGAGFSPRDAEHLAAHVLGARWGDLWGRLREPLSDDAVSRLDALLGRRLGGEPLAYILGTQPFRRLELLCGPGVLVPRPETEAVVDVALDLIDQLRQDTDAEPPTGEDSARQAGDLRVSPAEALRVPVAKTDARKAAGLRVPAAETQPVRPPTSECRRQRNGTDARPPTSECRRQRNGTDARPPTSECRRLRLVDVGTGTGAIALAVAGERPGTSVWATEVSDEALGYARRNVERTGLDVHLALGDLFDGLPADLRGRVDLVVSNPPYVDPAKPELLGPDVGREPDVALYGGTAGDEVLGRLIGEAGAWLRPGGALVLEVGTGAQLDRMRRRLGGWREAGVHEDHAGRPRVLWART